MRLRDTRQRVNAAIFSGALLLAFSLAACEPTPQQAATPQTAQPQAAAPVDPVLAYVSSGQIGQSAVINDPAQGGNIVVVIDTQYNSAAGEICRSYATTTASQQSQHLACADGANWQSVPPLISPSDYIAAQ